MKKKIRRGAILALVIALLFNTTVTAMGGTGSPTTIVDSYGALFTAVSEAQDGAVIGISGVITLPAIVNLNRDNKNITLVRMSESSQIVISGVYGDEAKATLRMITFDGRSGNTGENNPVGGSIPFIVVESNALFEMCDFENCSNNLGDGGAVSVTSSGNATFSSCSFDNNMAVNGASLSNEGTATVRNSTFKNSWAEENGGAIYNKGILTVDFTEIKENTAKIGGGLYNIASTEIYNSLIWSNTATSQGSDIANDASLSNFTTEEEFNSWLNYYNLFYKGWYNELDPLVGGAGEYRKFLTTETDPSIETPTPDPTEPPTTEEPDDPADKPTDPPAEPEDTGEDKDNTDPKDPPKEEDKEDKEDPEPTTPSTPSNVDNSTTNTDNSVTDNSTTDNSTTDNSQSTQNTTTTTDNSSSTDNHSSTTSNTSTVDNHSSSVSNTDNSSSRSESTKTENSNNTTSTTYNYYTTDKGGEKPVQLVGASPQPITVNVTVPEAKAVNTAPQEPTEVIKNTPQNIHIQAEGVNVNYDYTEDGVTINITPYTAPESPKEEPKEVQDKSWVEYATVILLAVLVLLEIADKFRSKKETL